MGHGQAPSEALSWVRVDLERLAGNVAAVLRISDLGFQIADVKATNGEHVPLRDAEPPASEIRNPKSVSPVICGVVKKNAYGLGATTVARTMQRSGCGMLAVYSPAEAEELVSAGLSLSKACPVLVLMPMYGLDRRDALYRLAAAEGLHVTLHSAKQAAMLDEAARRLGLRVPVHVHVDTGMSREGMGVDEAEKLWPTLRAMKGLRIAGLMSHLATADIEDGEFAGFAEQQEADFDAVVGRLEASAPGCLTGVLLHTGNSASVWRKAREGTGLTSGAPAPRHVIRPGIGLYGYVGDAGAGVRPIVRWCSRVLRVRRVPAGRTVGYRASATLQRDSVLALVPAGYGDGYPLGLSNKGKVVLRVREPGPGLTSGAQGRVASGASGASGGAVCRVVGRVNMDQLVIDVTTTVQQLGVEPETLLGCEVELYGDDAEAPNAIPRLAEAIDSHAYELLCRLNPRLPRVYV